MIRTANPIHRRNRRHLTLGQPAGPAGVAVAVTSSGTTNFTMTFDRPVVITGTILSTVTTRTLVSQTIVSPTVVTQVWSGNVTGLAYTVPTNDASIATYQGGRNFGAAGTFP